MNAWARSTEPTVCRPCASPRLATIVLLGCFLLVSTKDSSAATPVVAIHPCSLLTLEEVGAVVRGTATQDRPHVVAINKVPVGGNCTYRSAQNRLIVISLMVDANPNGHQPKAFDLGRQRSHVSDLSGLGDRAFTITNPKGPPTVTFLKGMVLVTINVQGLGSNEAKQLATLVAGRLPASTGAAPPPVSSRSVTPSPPMSQGSGKLDPALIGYWSISHPNGKRIATLDVKLDGTFFMIMRTAGPDRMGKPAKGKIGGDDGVLHLYTDQGVRTQEITYRVIDRNQMEWTDQKGNVTIVQRQSR